jgi:hypothetical protein
MDIRKLANHLRNLVLPVGAGQTTLPENQALRRGYLLFTLQPS